eukprot:gb/GECG01003057.1/.p1 GENE.gb/GECG01003057.1/~~gb/GECG01003057.1/.p1  ORF type:complete len:115 (+),score=12.90 gb/GECG01003057.1/:1-345(+)
MAFLNPVLLVQEVWQGQLKPPVRTHFLRLYEALHKQAEEPFAEDEADAQYLDEQTQTLASRRSQPCHPAKRGSVFRGFFSRKIYLNESVNAHHVCVRPCSCTLSAQAVVNAGSH